MSEAVSNDEAKADELKARLAAIERRLEAIHQEVETATNRDIPLLKGTVWAMIGAEVETIDELPAAGRAFAEELDERRERLSEIEGHLEVLEQSTNRSTKAEKIATVLLFASNKRGHKAKVTVTPAEIRGCTGVSRRYAYKLVDKVAAEVDGVAVREAKQVQTSSGTERKGKALLVDCEAVHDVNGAVHHTGWRWCGAIAGERDASSVLPAGASECFTQEATGTNVPIVTRPAGCLLKGIVRLDSAGVRPTWYCVVKEFTRASFHHGATINDPDDACNIAIDIPSRLNSRC